MLSFGLVAAIITLVAFVVLALRYVKGKKMFLYILKFVMVLSLFASAIKDSCELYFESQDNQNETNHSIEVRIVPTIKDNISIYNIMKNDQSINYEIFFINNNSSDVNISDINFCVGNDFGREKNIVANETRSYHSDSVTIKAGENYCISEEISLGKISYDKLKESFPTESERGSWISVYDEFLKEKYGSSNEQFTTIGMTDARNICVYYVLDYDRSKHMERFTIRYPGINQNGNDPLKDKISIEEAFEVTSESYKGE